MRAHRLTTEGSTRFAHVPAVDRERARVVVVPLLTPGVVAMTVGRWILVRRGRAVNVGLLAHELVHVQQWRECHALPFLVRYFGEYLRHRLGGRSHWDAYAAISFEVEAWVRSGA